jgi:hypothetical protein
MRYRFVLFAFAALLVLSSCFIRSSLNFSNSMTDKLPNELLNPGFESAGKDLRSAFRGWDIGIDPPDGKGTVVSIDTQVRKEGASSLRVNASDNGVLIYSDAFDVARYEGYLVRASARSTSPEKPQITLRFICFKENGKIANNYRKKLKTSEDWKEAQISAGFLRPGVQSGRVAILVPPFKDGSVWIDATGCWNVHHFRID